METEKKKWKFSWRDLFKKFSWRDLLNGKFLTEESIRRQSKLLFLIFCLILVFISNRYYCSKKLTEMDNLKNELVRLKNEQVDLTSRLTRISRQAQIEELLKDKGIELTKNNTTVYEIHK
jgi:hypothetical protein